MTCDDLVSYLSDYIDQNLDDALTSAAQEHLTTCQNCQIVLHTTQQTIQLGQKQYQVGIPPLRRDSLLTRVRMAFLTREISENTNTSNRQETE
jgi:hypothetical protein